MPLRPSPAAASRPRTLALCVLAVVARPVAVRAQGCGLGEGSSEFRQETVPGQGTIRYFRTPHFVCDDSVQIWADSAVAYEAQEMSVLIGKVRYVDRTRTLTSDQARYFSSVGRLQAQGHVHVVNSEDGSSIDHGDLVYLRQTDRRPVEEITVTTGRDGIRPQAEIPPPEPDSATATGGPPKPYTVVGDRIVLKGSNYFSSVGSVQIQRDSLVAFADSAEYQEDAGGLVMVGSARVESGSYDLVGRTVTLGSPDESGTSEVEALHDAVLTGKDLRLVSPAIRLYVNDGEVDRLVAVPIHPDSARRGPPPDSADAVRPVANSEDFDLTADSIDVAAPDAVVESILAAGKARSVSHGRDSLNVPSLPPIARSDWLEGDTVIVWLQSVPADSTPAAGAGSGAQYQVDSIVAHGNARSLYRLLPEDSTARAGVDPPAVHYVMGDEITIHMSEGEVQEMAVVGQTRGLHLEPVQPATAAQPADSTGAPAGARGPDALGKPGRPGPAVHGPAQAGGPGALDPDPRREP
jgi:lipopolysaccharide export system protein LptA